MSARIILASASPRRRELLAALVPGFEIAPAEIDESFVGSPIEAAVRLAMEKAVAVAAKHPGAAVIGSDTIVFDQQRAYGKPYGPADAGDTLRALRGRTHEVVTGVALVSPVGVASARSIATVTLTPLDDDAIDRYVASGRPLDKAGSYAIQDADVPTVATLDGCYCSVMGLPLWTLRALLLAAGMAAREPSATFARCATCPGRPPTA